MADLRTSFAILEDPSTQAGLPLHKVLEGDAAAGKNASAGLVAKDQLGNLKYLEINSQGELKITQENEDIACLKAYGTNAGSTSWVKIAAITLTASETYRDVSVALSSFRDTSWKIQSVEDVGVTDIVTEHAILRTGAGNLSIAEKIECLEFDAGATGVVELQIWGKNLNVASDMDATITVKEIQAVA